MTELEFSKLYQKKLLDIFKRTIDFLNSNCIRWWVCGGTALGTIRHKGFIPWDDDIDIFVLREDYEKLFDIRDQLLHRNLEMTSIEDGCGYYNGFIKIYDCKSTLWERREFPFIIGIYIDVFPIEKASIELPDFLKAYKHYRKTMNAYRNSITQVTLGYLSDLFRERHFKTFLFLLWNVITRGNSNKQYQKFLLSTRQIPFNKSGKYLMCVMGSYKEHDYYDAKIFDGTLKMSFEGIEVNVPVGYEIYLKSLYNEYLNLPPIEQRVSHHDHYYCNFSERLSIDQVIERINKGKNIEL